MPKRLMRFTRIPLPLGLSEPPLILRVIQADEHYAWPDYYHRAINAILLIVILDLLFTSREKASVLLAQLINHICGRFVWLPAQQTEIVQLIQEWARLQIFY
jgi:hypothetical protein